MPDFKPDDYNEITFSEAEQGQLVDFCQLLLQCNAIHDKDYRRRVLRMLPRNIQFNINDNDTPSIQVLEIVETCDRYEHGLKNLLKAVRYIETETKAWQAVEKFLDRFKKNGPPPPAFIPPVPATPAPVSPSTPEFERLSERLKEAEAAKDWDEAIRLGNSILKLEPGHRAIRLRIARAYYGRGELYYDEKNYGQAVTDYDKAIQLNPNDATPYKNRGRAYGALKEYAKAIVDCNKAIQLSPNDAYNYQARGAAYYYL